MKKALFFIPIFMSITAFSQIDSQSLMGLPSVTNLTDITSLTGVNNGSLAFVINEQSVYVYNGTAWNKLNSNANTITNEILLEDTNFIYVSVLINGTNWMVTRYHKNSLNTETLAMGAGAQPTTLAAVTALTFS